VITRTLPTRPTLLAATALLALSACKRDNPNAGQMPPQAVGVVTLHPSAVDIHTSLPGRTNAFEIAEVRPQVTGVIEKRLFVEGSDVIVGQQLYQIDASRYKATFDSAQGQLEQARARAVTASAKARRYRDLVRTHAVSSQDYDDAVAAEKEALGQVMSARGQVESAQVDLAYTKMYAPITGRISRTITTVGALVTANQSQNLAIITRLDPIYVDVNLPAITLLRLRRELADGRIKPQPDGRVPVTVTMEDGSLFKQTGRMALAEVNVDTTTSTVIVRAIMPNPDKLLLPGMYVHAQLDEGTDPNALLVPQEAVSRNTHGDPQVWIVGADNAVSLRQITLGQAMGSSWVVLSGLANGDRVVVSGVQKIRPGMKVAPQETPAPSEQTGASTAPASPAADKNGQ
jgi:membrane fusion protein (multidrug efflux system)